ncbi:MAG: ABC-F family ATP-binding cassette domain-containing protein, partial [bacterium]|nr:ABC-F family ATP-binding cassette domain-containing protein [bacterium]
ETYTPAPHPYTAFLAERDVRREEARREYERYVAERDKRRETIAGLRATLTSSNYSRVRSREKQLARVEATESASAPDAPRATIAVRLDAARRAGNGFAFETRDLAKAYGERGLFSGLTLEVMRGERLAVVGPNGSGKSTFLKILDGTLVPDRGIVRYNPAARVAYFAQNAHEQLDAQMRAVDAVMTLGGTTNERARNLLGRMLLGGDAAEKPVSAFSGGERRRIMLACLMAREADVLLLDEPTNDLDIASRDALESVLDEYAGTVVVVSHDRYLLSRVCDRVLWIDDGAWGVLDGGYDAYEAAQRERERARFDEPRPAERPKTSRQTPLKVRSQLESKIARVERDIAANDRRKAEIDALFATPDLYEDRARVAALDAERSAVTTRGEELVATWETLLLEHEALDAQ